MNEIDSSKVYLHKKLRTFQKKKELTLEELNFDLRLTGSLNIVSTNRLRKAVGIYHLNFPLVDPLRTHRKTTHLPLLPRTCRFQVWTPVAPMK